MTFAEIAVAIGMTPAALAERNAAALDRIANRIGTGRDQHGNSAAPYRTNAARLRATYLTPTKD